jgi:hypothetical protein
VVVRDGWSNAACLATDRCSQTFADTCYDRDKWRQFRPNLPDGLRVDIKAKTTWAFPVLPFGPPSSSGAYIVRLHDGAEYVLSTEEQSEAVSEGFVWKDDAEGARLPAEVLDAERDNLPSFATGCVESRLSTQTGKEWAAEHANMAFSTVWRNEEAVGERLVCAEKRAADNYLSVRSIKEVTPEGWVRTRDGHGIRRV